MRVALLGGSFDPIHEGHLKIAKMALKKLAIDEVWFLVSYDTPLKDGQKVSFVDRVKMVDWAIKPYRKFKSCLIEKEVKGKSYTYDTIKRLKKRYPQISFSFLIGDDQAKAFDKWKNAQQLLEEVDFYVFSREKDYELKQGFKRVKMVLIDVSSSEIRQGEKRHYLPKAVKRYIGEHQLYVEEVVKKRISEKRWQHSLSVAKMCIHLAQIHGLDEKKAYYMGIIHDISKYEDIKKMQIWMKYHEKAKMHYHPNVYHGFIGAYTCKHDLYIRDKQIINAIYHHVLGDGLSSYDQILFISDKIDPLRGYDISKQLQKCEQDLKTGFEYVKNEQEHYLKKQGVE